MFVKTKERAGRTVYFLCIPEDGGNGARSWKAVEYSVCLGETFDLSGTQWVEILHASPVLRSVSLEAVLAVVEQYVSAHGLASGILDGLRAAVHEPKQQKKSRRRAHGERRSQEDARTTALRLLGLPPGSSEVEIESAFRRAALRHHPDVGGDPEKFRSIVDARDLLLGRGPRVSEPA
ncbi:MAG TPA: DnaJ domain-containing protein [Patescibacteria group bacterium]|nr:DnaJ domain-containing protein [Patescibacteria group bacterium]